MYQQKIHLADFLYHSGAEVQTNYTSRAGLIMVYHTCQHS